MLDFSLLLIILHNEVLLLIPGFDYVLRGTDVDRALLSDSLVGSRCGRQMVVLVCLLLHIFHEE